MKGYAQYFNPAVKVVPLLYWLNVASVPFVWLFMKLRLSPNAVTTLSNIVSFGAVLCLAFFDRPWLFVLLLMLGLFFDIADGIMARKMSVSSPNGSFYDHFSDMIKVALLFVAVAVRYQDTVVTYAAFAVNALFLLMCVANHHLSERLFRLKTAGGELPDVPAKPKSVFKQFLARHELMGCWNAIYSALFYLYGNAMCYFIFFPFGRWWALGSMVMFAVAVLKTMQGIIETDVKVNVELHKLKCAWK